MSTPVRVAGFGVAVAAVFGLALVTGRVVGPVDQEAAAGHGDSHAAEADAGHDTGQDVGHDSGHDAAAPAADVPGGLMVAQDGYTLDLATGRAAAGQDRPVSFTIIGPDGRAVTDYDVEHEKRLHLIAVRRDQTGFQHVHPTLGRDGTWRTGLDLTPGDWRLFADFKAAGAEALTLGADLAVTGHYRPVAPVRETRTAAVGDYEVVLDGELRAGADARLTVSVTKDGEPVTDLQPYLGAYGHLVALRGGDLAYLHVHPDGTPGDGTTEAGPDVVFYATVPSDGTYHLYLDFQHAGVVRTAAFTVTAGPAAERPADPAEPTESESSHAH